MEIKIVPVDEHGVIDHDYYSDSNFEADVKYVKKYLKDEGFVEMDSSFTIRLNKRNWHCSPSKKKK